MEELIFFGDVRMRGALHVGVPHAALSWPKVAHGKVAPGCFRLHGLAVSHFLRHGSSPIIDPSNDCVCRAAAIVFQPISLVVKFEGWEAFDLKALGYFFLLSCVDFGEGLHSLLCS